MAATCGNRGARARVHVFAVLARDADRPHGWCRPAWGSRAPVRAPPRRVLSSAPMPASPMVEFLKRTPVFAALPAREVQALATVAREEEYRTRDYVFMEGEPARWFCLVRRGHVKIVRHARTGRDVVMELLGAGEMFGGVAVIERRPYPASAQATEPSAVVKIPQEAIVALAEREPSIIREIAL